MSWKDYSGKDGYHRMIKELRDSVSDQFPEVQGRVYIFDHLNDSDEEIASAASALGLTSLSLKSQAVEFLNTVGRDGSGFPIKTQGTCFPVQREDGTLVFLAFGAHPSDSNLTPDVIKWLAWHNLHEATHGILFAEEGNALPATPTTDEKHAYQKYLESFAETVSHAALVQNGDNTHNHYIFAADYDFRKIEQGFERYDPGPALSKILSLASVYSPELLSYKFDHLRETYNLAKKYVHQYTADDIAEQKCANQAMSVGLQGLKEDEAVTWLNQRRDILPDAPRIIAGKTYLEKHEIDDISADPYVSPLPENGTIGQSIARAGIRALQSLNSRDELLFSELLSCVSHHRPHPDYPPISNLQASAILKDNRFHNIARRLLTSNESEERLLGELEAMSIESPSLFPELPQSSKSR